MSILDFGPNAANGASLSLTMTGTSAHDMSETLTSDTVYLGRRKLVTVTASWPASTGDAKPTGVIALQNNSTMGADGVTPDASAWQTISECSDAAIVAGQPDGSGDAGVLKWRNVTMGDSHLRAVYTPSNGGAGVELTITVNAKE